MPPNDATLAVLTQKVDNLLADAGERREQMTELVRAVQKLAVIEERQSADRGALERVFSTIATMHIKIDKNDADLRERMERRDEEIDRRVRKLEESDPLNKLSSGFVMKAMWLVIAGFLGATVSGAFKGATPAMIQVAPAAPQAPAQTTTAPK